MFNDSHNFTHTSTVAARSLSTCSGVVGCKWESQESRPRRGRSPCQAHRKRNTQTDGLLSSPKNWAFHMVQRNYRGAALCMLWNGSIQTSHLRNSIVDVFIVIVGQRAPLPIITGTGSCFLLALVSRNSTRTLN